MGKPVHHKGRKKLKKRYIIVPLAILLVIAIGTGGLIFFYKNRNTQANDNENSHSQVATDSVQKDEKILVRTEADAEPVYINAIEGMPRNSYNDDGFYTDENGFIAYKQNGKEISTVGVDVSYVQGDIDWQAVKAAGVDFAIIRCGGRGYGEKGILYTDEKFKQNIEGATDAGLDVGVYFYSQAVSVEEAEEEAQYTLELISDYKLKYPVVFDWEHYELDDARTDNVDRDTLTQIALKYCDVVQKSGYTPVVYANRSLLYFEYDLAKLINTEIWLASYEDNPDYYYDFGIWQYSTEGKVDGIKSDVDLNVCMYAY
ncbi:MAG: glycoside hydrolase family 25 protein [Ruminococcus sp.]|nr:glycoside hydrolase family 25 protein [Ruminococcus sp.]